MSAGNLKGWPKSEMLNYGIPKPVFVIPAAYVNKQAAEWPPGHKLNPCVIPPPEVTLDGTILNINGTNIDLASLSGGAGNKTVTLIASVANVLTIDYSVGQYFRVNLTENITSILFTNLPAAGTVASISIVFKQGAGAYTVNWPTEFYWEDGVTPTVSGTRLTLDTLNISTLTGVTSLWFAELKQAWNN